jgi:hypothetical protein
MRIITGVITPPMAADLVHRILLHVSGETQKEEKWAVNAAEVLWPCLILGRRSRPPPLGGV